MVVGKSQILFTALALVLGISVGPMSCAPQKRTYTVPHVTKEIETGIRKARKLKRSGDLKDASEFVLELTGRVLKEFPSATLTQEPVKKLVNALEWMANMCLDRSLELKNESVSATQDSLSKKFRIWSDEHRQNMSKLRAMIPRLKKAAVAARRAAPRPTGEAKGKASPRPAGGDAMQPTPDDPRSPASEPGAEPQ
jgi:hypothetical protein